MNDFLMTTITIESLRAVISETVKAELTKHLSVSSPPTQQPDLLTRKQAASFLGISLPTLHDFTKAGKVKGYRIGTRVRFKRSELEASLKQIRAVKPN